MPRYSETSLKRLETAHPDLRVLFMKVIEGVDNSIIVAYRSEDSQNKAFEEGKSKLRYPNSNHNLLPSMAIDAAPYPIKWDDLKRFYYFAGFVKATAQQLLESGKIHHKIRWGGDWDSDNDFSDQNFNDLVHFELIKP